MENTSICNMEIKFDFKGLEKIVRDACVYAHIDITEISVRIYRQEDVLIAELKHARSDMLYFREIPLECFLSCAISNADQIGYYLIDMLTDMMHDKKINGGLPRPL